MGGGPGGALGGALDANNLQLQLLLQMIQSNQRQQQVAGRSTGQNPSVGEGISSIGKDIANALLQMQAQKAGEKASAGQQGRADFGTTGNVNELLSNPAAVDTLPVLGQGERSISQEGPSNVQLPERSPEQILQGRLLEKLKTGMSFVDAANELKISPEQLRGTRASTTVEGLGGPGSEKGEEALEVAAGLTLSASEQASLSTSVAQNAMSSFGNLITPDQVQALVDYSLDPENNPFPSDLPESITQMEQVIRAAGVAATTAYQQGQLELGAEGNRLQGVRNNLTNSAQAWQKTFNQQRLKLSRDQFDLAKETQSGQHSIALTEMFSRLGVAEDQGALVRAQTLQLNRELESGELTQNSLRIRALARALRALPLPTQDVTEEFDDDRKLLTDELMQAMGFGADVISANNNSATTELLLDFLVAANPVTPLLPGPPGQLLPDRTAGRPERTRGGVTSPAVPRAVITSQEEYKLLRDNGWSIEEIREKSDIGPGVIEQ